MFNPCEMRKTGLEISGAIYLRPEKSQAENKLGALYKPS